MKTAGLIACAIVALLGFSLFREAKSDAAAITCIAVTALACMIMGRLLGEMSGVRIMDGGK